MGVDQLTDLNALDESLLFERKPEPYFAVIPLRAEHFISAAMSTSAVAEHGPQIFSGFMWDLMFCNTSPHPMNLKVIMEVWRD